MILRSEGKSNFDVQLCEESYFWGQFGIIHTDLELVHVFFLKDFCIIAHGLVNLRCNALNVNAAEKPWNDNKAR